MNSNHADDDDDVDDDDDDDDDDNDVKYDDYSIPMITIKVKIKIWW